MEVKQPDPHRHFIISIVKSIMRIGAGILMLTAHEHNLQLAGCILIAAEVLGIFEELV